MVEVGGVCLGIYWICVVRGSGYWIGRDRYGFVLRGILRFFKKLKEIGISMRTATSVGPAPKDCAKDYRLTYYMKDYRVDNIDLLEHSGRFPTKGAIRRSRSSDCGRIFYGDLDYDLDSRLSIRIPNWTILRSEE